MRATLAYTSARILLLVISVILLYLVGARGLLLLALAFLVSGIASFVLLSRQRDVMSRALMGRPAGGRRRASEFRARIEEGARAEDEDVQRLLEGSRYARTRCGCRPCHLHWPLARAQKARTREPVSHNAHSFRTAGPTRIIGAGVPDAPETSGTAASHPPLISSFSTAPTAWPRLMAEVSSTRSASRGSS
jgi:hypothetical protein